MILKRLIILLLINIPILIGISNYKLSATEYYVQIHTVKQKNIEDFENYIIGLKEVGISGIFLRVFQNKIDSYHSILPIKNKTGVYFNNNINIPVVNPMLDNLKPTIPVYAWMSSRWMDWIKGKKFGRYLLLQNNNNFQIITATYKDLSKKNINGVLIQDDLIIKIKEERIYHINNKISIILKYIKSIKKCFPDKPVFANIYYEVPANQKTGDKWYGQNIKQYLNSGIDNLVIMLYSEQIKRELKLNNKKLYKYIKHIIDNLEPYKEKTYIKLQIIDFKTGRFLKIDKIIKIIRLIPFDFKGIIFTPVRTDKFTLLYLKSLIHSINNLKK